MIRISKKWLKTDRDCLSIHKLYVFNLICTLHNTTAVRFAIYRYPSIFQSNSKCLQSTPTQFWFQQSIGPGSLVYSMGTPLYTVCSLKEFTYTLLIIILRCNGVIFFTNQHCITDWFVHTGVIPYKCICRSVFSKLCLMQNMKLTK